MAGTSGKVSVTPFHLANSRMLWKTHSYLLLSVALFILNEQEIHMNVTNTSVFFIYRKWLISRGPKVFIGFQRRQKWLPVSAKEYKSNP